MRTRFVSIILCLTLVIFFGFGSPATAKDAKDLKIVYIPKNTGNPYFDSIINGFKKASEELGFTFTTTAPATAEATSQIPFIKTQMQRKVDVIAISPNSPDALNRVFKQAMDRGIKVVIVNSDIPGSEDYRHVAILPMDFEVTGSSPVELLAKLPLSAPRLTLRIRTTGSKA
jgi:rhamnose transport system substrate-binding protein